MRRTQQNADQQRRRGVRSRLVACVAAVAMLVTSVAAGTAVAAELGGGDAADQTTQNTATLEQQGTDNTGDNNQTTTDDDGQADGNQSTDADSGSEGDEGAADNGAADGAGVTESDDQAQGGAATKSANAVPAPQSEAEDVATQADSTGSVLLDESFRGTTADSRWKAYGDACLTAAALQGSFGTDGRQLSGCNRNYTTDTESLMESGMWDNPQAGFLQLTDNRGSRSGNVLFDRAIPTSAGLDISFYEYQYATSNTGEFGAADGIGFFLTDGDYTMSEPGPNGASLGYAPLEQDGRESDGIVHGVLGVGLDVFGNFSSTLANGDDNRYNCPTAVTNSQRPNSVALRGQGDGREGYCLLASNQYYQNRQRIDLETNPAQAGDSDDNGKLVRIVISPQTEDKNSTVTVSVNGNVALEYTLTYRLPDTVKFGFSASTGGGHEAHLIRGLKASTVDPLPSGIDLVKSIDKESDLYKTSYQSGDKVPYTFLITNGDGSDLTNVTLSDEHLDAETLQCEASLDWLAAADSVLCKGTYTLTDADTEMGSFTNTATVTGWTSMGEEVTSADSETIDTIPSVKPSIRKWIDKNDGANDEYTLNLSVTGNGTSTAGTPSEPAKVDVVFVLDKSPSMGGCIGSDNSSTSCGWGKTSRLSAMQSAATDLVDTISGNESVDAQFGIVTFHGSADRHNFGRWLSPEYMSGDSDDVKVAINDISTWRASGTNWNAGLSQVNSYSPREGAQNYVVFLTDGVPNAGTGQHTQTGTGLVAEGWNVLNIGVDLPRNNDSLSKLTDAEKRSASENQIVRQFDSDDESSLHEIFTQIAGIIGTPGTQTSQGHVIITDDISQWADAVDIETQGGGTVTDGVTVTMSPALGGNSTNVTHNTDIIKSITLQNNVLTVTFADGYMLPNGTTFTVSFKVKPSEQAYSTYARNVSAGKTGDAGYTHDDSQIDKGEANTGDASVNQPGFFSNDSATLSYRQCTSTDGNDPVCASKDPLTYNKPVLQVKTTSLKVTKQWSDGNELHADGSVTVNIIGDGITRSPLSLNADNGWTDSFTGLIPGCTYTVTEKTVDGYTTSYSYTADSTSHDGNQVQIDVEDVWKSEPTVFAMTVSNAVNEVGYGVGDHLDLNKVFEGKDLASGEFRFTLTNVTADMDSDTDPSGMTFHEYSAIDMGDPVLNDDGIPAMSVTVENGNNSTDPNEVGGFDFGAITFTKSGTYYVKVNEVIPPDEDKEAGVVYDDHALYVRYEVTSDGSGLHFVAEENRTIVDENGDPVDPGKQDALLTWTNRYVAVSALPLTGGDATARVLLLAGGGVLLVAGVAWLLARRRRV